jgi:hypothetical protein
LTYAQEKNNALLTPATSKAASKNISLSTKEQAFIWVRRFLFTAPSRELNLRLRIED